MATTENNYTGNGTLTSYTFSFPYIKKEDVRVTLDEIGTTAFTINDNTPTQIDFTTAPGNNVAIRIFRVTDNAAVSSVFFPGSSIRAKDLNSNFEQALYIGQEEENKIQDVISGGFADGTVTTAKIVDNAVTNNKLANNAVTTAKIADNAVTTAKIADNAVTSNKINPGAIEAELNTISIDSISDVDTTSVAPSEGQALVWSASTNQWKPGNIANNFQWNLTANGTTDYIFSGPGFAGTETDPTLYVVRGHTYEFTNAMGAHPFQIQSTQGASGTAYNNGITNNGVSNGTLTWEVRMDAPSTLYYQCTSHALMAGTIYVLDEGATSINGLTDVDTTSVAPTNGQALVWDNVNSQWKPGTISGGGGSITVDNSADVLSFVADGAITSGSPVVLNDDGTVSEVGSLTSAGPEVALQSGNSTAAIDSAISYNTNQNKLLNVWTSVDYNQDTLNSSVSTVTNGVISSGSTTSVVSTGGGIELIYDPINDKHVLFYTDSVADEIRAVVATISGTTVTWSTPVTLKGLSANLGYVPQGLEPIWDPDSQQIWIFWYDRTTNANGIHYKSIDVSGSTLVQGTEYYMGSQTSNCSYPQVVYDTVAGKIIVFYFAQYNGSGAQTLIQVGTVSTNGTTISWGLQNHITGYQINNGQISLGYDSTNARSIVLFRDVANDNFYIGTLQVVGTNVVYGNQVYIHNGSMTSVPEILHDPIGNRNLIVFEDVGNSNKATYMVAIIRNGVMTVGPKIVFVDDYVSKLTAAYNTGANGMNALYAINSPVSMSVRTASTSSTTNVDTSNFIGFAAANIADTQSGVINIKTQINTVQTGLTPGKTYYIQPQGGIGLTPSIPSIIAGTSLSSTKILAGI